MPMSFRKPDRDLCADLRNDVDVKLGEYDGDKSFYGEAPVVCSATNAQLRLYVAGWMLGDDARAAYALYRDSGLLDAPGLLTTDSIVAEVLGMIP
jgi:hypothetical protein